MFGIAIQRRQPVKNALYIVWQPSNETGVPIIDEQHRGIVSTINSLHYFIQHGDSAVVFEPTMDVLNHYTSLHFLAEEALMLAAGYPDIDEHVDLHNKFMNQVRSMAKYRADHDQEDALLKLLKTWWLHHINQEDKKFVAIVKKQLGLK
jgi:hemerythrin